MKVLEIPRSHTVHDPVRCTPAIGMDALALRLAVAGFDIAQPLSTTWYNEHLVGKGLPLKPLPSYGREGGALCVLIGNSRELWNAFLRWLRTQSDPMGIEEPLDLYTRGTIADAVAEAAEGVAYDIFWPSESGDRLVSMQRVALTSGLCCHDGETQLCIHPTFGAWCAFRAAVVFDRDGPAGGAPPPCPDLLSDAERAAAREAMANALKASNEERICEQCALVTYRYLPLHTVTSNEERICEQLHGGEAMTTDVRLAWAKLRDCVLLGREEHRYSDAQLTYHYTKDKTVLQQALHESWESFSARSYDSAQDDRPWH